MKIIDCYSDRTHSVYVTAEMLVRSPRKLFISSSKITFRGYKVISNIINFILITKSMQSNIANMLLIEFVQNKMKGKA